MSIIVFLRCSVCLSPAGVAVCLFTRGRVSAARLIPAQAQYPLLASCLGGAYDALKGCPLLGPSTQLLSSARGDHCTPSVDGKKSRDGLECGSC